MGLRLVAELGGDGSGYEAMMRRAHGTKDRFAAAFSGLRNIVAGAFTVGAVTNLSRRTLDLASHLRDVSDALKVNVEWFQKRANAAKLAGGSEDDLFKFIDVMGKSRAAAVEKPGGPEAAALGRLGFSGADISGLNTMEFFDRLVKAYGDGANAQTAVDVEKVGGRSARNLLASFSSGLADNVPIMSEDFVDALDDIGDQLTIVSQLLLVNFAPALKAVADAAVWSLNKMRTGTKGLEGFFGGYLSKAQQDKRADGQTGWAGYFANIADGLAEGWKTMFEDVAEETARQTDEAAAQTVAKQRERAARRKRESGAPGFDVLTPEDKAAKSARPHIASDSLVGIGNFLGRNPALVNNVASQQLQVARQQLSVSQQMLTAIQNLKVSGTPVGMNILVPGV